MTFPCIELESGVVLVLHRQALTRDQIQAIAMFYAPGTKVRPPEKFAQCRCGAGIERFSVQSATSALRSIGPVQIVECVVCDARYPIEERALEAIA